MTAKSLKHKFQSSVADGTDATLARPSDWNADHDLWMGYRSVTAATDTITNADHLSLVTYNNGAGVAVGIAAPSSGNMPLGWKTRVRNIGSGDVTITGTGGATINGNASATIKQNGTLDIHSTGATDYQGVPIPAPQAAPPPLLIGGALKYVSATALSYLPFKGNQIVINGNIFTIPSSGVVGLGNTSVYVNGVAGQNLAASTLYYVYCWSNSGVLTADFSTTGHATSIVAGNSGTEIKSGDETRTLIGMIRTNASSQFQDSPTLRTVRSWINDKAILCTNYYTASRAISTSMSEINAEIRIGWLNWADEIIDLRFASAGYGGSGSGITLRTWIVIDPDGSQIFTDAYGYSMHYADANTWDTPAYAYNNPSEGFHLASIFASSGATQPGNYYLNASTPGNRPVLQGRIGRR